MILTPAWALLGLILATIVFGWLGWRWQRHAHQLQEQLDAVLARSGALKLNALTEGWAEGSRTAERRVLGACYQAVSRAQRQGADPLAAIVALGQAERVREVAA